MKLFVYIVFIVFKFARIRLGSIFLFRTLLTTHCSSIKYILHCYFLLLSLQPLKVFELSLRLSIRPIVHIIIKLDL